MLLEPRNLKILHDKCDLFCIVQWPILCLHQFIVTKCVTQTEIWKYNIASETQCVYISSSVPNVLLKPKSENTTWRVKHSVSASVRRYRMCCSNRNHGKWNTVCLHEFVVTECVTQTEIWKYNMASETQCVYISSSLPNNTKWQVKHSVFSSVHRYRMCYSNRNLKIQHGKWNKVCLHQFFVTECVTQTKIWSSFWSRKVNVENSSEWCDMRTVSYPQYPT